jgi:hypothetical protein
MGAHGLLKEEIKKPVHDSFSHDFKTWLLGPLAKTQNLLE